MPFLVLLYLTSTCLALQVNWGPPVPGASVWQCSVAMALATSLTVLAAGFLARWSRWRLLRRPEHRDILLHRYASLRLLHVFLLFAVFGLTVAYGWGWTVQQLCSVGPADLPFGPDGRRLLPGAELLLIAPFLLALILSWACFYDVEQFIHSSPVFLACGERPFWSRWGYVGHQLRLNLALVLVPLVLLIAAQGVLRQFQEVENDWRFQLAAFGVLGLVFVAMPWILRLVLGLRPLPDGPLRQRLLEAARRVHFRFSNILLWNTHNHVANAMVVGVLPWVRYVLLTDRLAEELTPEEVEAVFGHEIGHVKHHHMLYYLGFLMLSLAVVFGAWTVLWLVVAHAVGPDELALLAPDWGGESGWQILTLVPLLGAYIFVVFGFLSRRCERQADIYGCRLVSCPYRLCLGHDLGESPLRDGRHLCSTGIRTFISALEKVARINGINRTRPGFLQSWQHSTIARRVEFLQRLLTDPALEPRFQRAVARVKWVMFFGLGATLIGLAALLYVWFPNERPTPSASPGMSSAGQPR